MKKSSGLLLIASAFVFTACTQESGPTVGVSPTRSQELHISHEVKEVVIKKGIHEDYSITLNNLDKSNANLLLSNRGGKPLKIEKISIKDPKRVFKLKSHCSKVIDPGDSCKVNVAFTGVEEGHFESVITIKSNDIRLKNAHVMVKASSVNKYKATLSSHSGEKVEVKRDMELKFNAVNNYKYVTIRNNGLDSIDMKRLSLSGPGRKSFSVDSKCPSILPVNETCDIDIRYNPKEISGYSMAQLNISSNADVLPSSKVRLVGYYKPYDVNIEKFVVSKNIHDFLDDYFMMNQKFYFRTIFQTNVSPVFETYVDNEIQSYFKKNGYRLAASASDADKVITIYPTVQIPEAKEGENDMLFNIKVNGYLSSKASTSGKIKSQDNNITFDHFSNNTKFSSISTIDSYINKESFEFGLVVKVDSVSDAYEVYSTVSNIMIGKLFNVLGMKDSKGSK
jgi:hypothetical protein